MHSFKYSQQEQIFRLCEWSFRFRNNPKSLEIQCAEDIVHYQTKSPSLKKVWMYNLYQVNWLKLGIRDARSLTESSGLQWNYQQKQVTMTTKMILKVNIHFWVRFHRCYSKINCTDFILLFPKNYFSNKYIHFHSYNTNSHSNCPKYI